MTAYATQRPRSVVENTFSSYEEDLYRYFYRRVGLDRATAWDLTQSTFESALRSSGTTPSVVAEERAWLMTIARRRLIDHYRRRGVRRRQVLPGNPPPEGVDEQAATSDAVVRALSSIPRRYAVVLLLRYVDDLSPSETAEVLGRSIKSIESTTVRARASFRSAYAREASDG